MSRRNQREETCAVCGAVFPSQEVVPGAIVREAVSREIQRAHPDWSADKFICRNDLATMRGRYFHSILESEKGELSKLEREVLESLHRHDLMATNVDEEFGQKWTQGERLADRIASFGGSWAFLICFGVFLVFWIGVNSLVLVFRPVDPYPFILLNLMLSCLAALQAPIIMMSQNRQEAKDRIRSQHDYQINLKAELEIRHLHDKIDHLLSHQWERLVSIQEMQLELLEELGSGKDR